LILHLDLWWKASTVYRFSIDHHILYFLLLFLSALWQHRNYFLLKFLSTTSCVSLLPPCLLFPSSSSVQGICFWEETAFLFLFLSFSSIIIIVSRNGFFTFRSCFRSLQHIYHEGVKLLKPCSVPKHPKILILILFLDIDHIRIPLSYPKIIIDLRLKIHFWIVTLFQINLVQLCLPRVHSCLALPINLGKFTLSLVVLLLAWFYFKFSFSLLPRAWSSTKINIGRHKIVILPLLRCLLL